MPRSIDNADPGPPPAKRAVLGLLLGLVAGAVASVLLPAEPGSQPTSPAAE